MLKVVFNTVISELLFSTYVRRAVKTFRGEWLLCRSSSDMLITIAVKGAIMLYFGISLLNQIRNRTLVLTVAMLCGIVVI